MPGLQAEYQLAQLWHARCSICTATAEGAHIQLAFYPNSVYQLNYRKMLNNPRESPSTLGGRRLMGLNKGLKLNVRGRINTFIRLVHLN